MEQHTRWCYHTQGWWVWTTRIMEGVTVAIVRAPGGVPIGFCGP